MEKMIVNVDGRVLGFIDKWCEEIFKIAVTASTNCRAWQETVRNSRGWSDMGAGGRERKEIIRNRRRTPGTEGDNQNGRRQ